MKILHLPLWVPNKNDIQLGNFIQEHIALSAINNEVHSLVFLSDENIEKIKIESSSNATRIYYPKSRNRIINFFRFLKAAKMGVEAVKKKGFEPEPLDSRASRLMLLASVPPKRMDEPIFLGAVNSAVVAF